MVFQEFRLLDEMNVFENVALAQRVVGVSSREKRRKISLAMLEMVGLAKKLKAYPNELSGGEQQRVAIARAMVIRPAILLADEPTGALDTASGLNVMKLFKDLVAKEGITIVMTTHDPNLMELGDVVFEIEDGEIIGKA